MSLSQILKSFQKPLSPILGIIIATILYHYLHQNPIFATIHSTIIVYFWIDLIWSYYCGFLLKTSRVTNPWFSTVIFGSISIGLSLIRILIFDASSFSNPATIIGTSLSTLVGTFFAVVGSLLMAFLDYKLTSHK